MITFFHHINVQSIAQLVFTLMELFVRNPILKSQMQEVYNLPVEFASKANACIGAALAVQVNVSTKS